ncbi:hypothetical protein ACFLT9_01950 [Acidobacteriota bacterium]
MKVTNWILMFIVVLPLFCFFPLSGQEYDKKDQLDSNLPDLMDFSRELKELVLKYYPKADISETDISLKFEYETREFTVHAPLKTGGWSEIAHKVKGPRNVVYNEESSQRESGIVGTVSLEPQQYIAQITRPQTLDYSYFKHLMLAPESKKFECHLMADLKYPYETREAFVKAFTELVNSFEKYLK